MDVEVNNVGPTLSTEEGSGVRSMSTITMPETTMCEPKPVLQKTSRYSLEDAHLSENHNTFNFLPQGIQRHDGTMFGKHHQAEASAISTGETEDCVHRQAHDEHVDALRPPSSVQRPSTPSTECVTPDVHREDGPHDESSHEARAADSMFEEVEVAATEGRLSSPTVITDDQVTAGDLESHQNDVNVSLTSTAHIGDQYMTAATADDAISDNGQLPTIDQSPHKVLSSPVAGQSRRSSIDSHKQSPAARVLQPQNHGHRVTKQIRQQQAVGQYRSDQSQPSSSPTAEDLVYLLIRKRRKEAAEHTRLQHAYDQAVAENEELRVSNTSIQADLEDTKEQWHAYMRQDHRRNGIVEANAQKYSNLKKCTHILAEQYAQLREASATFKHELTGLSEHASNTRQETAALRRDCEHALNGVKAMKSGIHLIKADVAIIDKLQTQVVQKQVDLDEQKKDNREHISVLLRLEKSQHSFESAVFKKHNEIAARLTSLSHAARGWDNTAFAKVTAPVIDALRNIRQAFEASDRNVAQVQTLETAVTACKDGIKSIRDNLQNVRVDQQANSQLRMSAIEAALNELLPAHDTVNGLQNEKTSLTETLKSRDEQVKALQRDKNAQHLFTMGLLEAHKQVTAPNDVVDERAVAEHWKHKYDQANELLADRCSNLERLTAENATAEETLRVKAAEEQSTKVALEQAQNARKNAEAALSAAEKQLGAKDQEVLQLRKELGDIRTVVNGLELQAAELEQKRTQLQQQSAQLQQRVQEQSRVIDQFKSEAQTLREENAALKRHQENAISLQAKVAEFEALRTLCGKVSSNEIDLLTTHLLSTRLNQLPLVIRELDQARSDSQNKDAELTKLRQLPSELQITRDNLASAAERYEHLQQQYQATQVEAQKVPKLEHDLKDCRQTVQQLRGQLQPMIERQKTASDAEAQLRDTKAQVQKLSGYNQQLRTDVHSKDQELVKAIEAKSKQDEHVKELESRAAKYDKIKKEMEAIRDESQRKESELTSVRDRLHALELDSARFDPLRHQFSEEEIRQFDEPIVLSMQAAMHLTQSQRLADSQENHVVPDSQAQNQDAAESANVNDGVQRIFSDFVNMGAISPPDFINSSPPHATQRPSEIDARPVSSGKTRAGSQNVHAHPVVEDEDTITLIRRASPAPNSAIKRPRAVATSDNPSKRLRAMQLSGNPNAKTTSTGTRTSSPKTTRFENDPTVIPDSQGRTSSNALFSAAAPGQRKKTNATPRVSKKDR